MLARFARFVKSLPASRWLPVWVGRIRASIYTKLLVSLLGIVIALVVLGAVGLSALQDADERAAGLVQLERRIAAYRQLQHNATGQLYAVTSAFITNDPRQLDAALRRLQRFAYDFDRAEFVVGEDHLRLLQRIEADYEDLIRVGTRVIELVREGNREDALALHHGSSIPLANRLERNSYTLVNKAEADMVSSAELSNDAYRVSQTIMNTASIVSILFALVVGYALSASLIEPVRAIAARVRRIAGGDFTGELDVRNRDELGHLAKNVNRMSRKLDRLYRELETANRHKSTFLANMSHELRTPMNAIIGFNRLVMRRCKDILPEKQYENLGKIAVSADHLLTLINTVLDLSKIEAGRVEVHPCEFALAPLLDVCARTAEPLLEGKDVKLIKDLSPTLPVMYTDQDKARQILLNLLSNATKFTERGRILLTARCEYEAVTISVTDTGIGMPAEDLPRIFEEFTQIDTTATRRYTGTGLGLAISQRLAHLLGGEIAAQSEPGHGSTFTLNLPVRFHEPRADLDGDADESESTEKELAS